jgi:predicted acylesterase/phospholipase RssA
MRYLLSIRGGGIRGIIPTCCLIELEAKLGGLTRDHVAYCAGTSTGALLAAAVAAGLPATNILKMYTDRSEDIFTPTGVLADAKRVVEGYMYDADNLRDVLVSIFGALSQWTINDAPIGLMISATAMNGHNWFFVKDNPKNEGTTGKVNLIDAAVASSCAPTFFNYWTIDNIDGKNISFFDGGVGGTANPAYQACVEAFLYDDFAPADTRVIALGTGYYPQSETPPKGLLATVGWTTNTLVDSSEDWVDRATRLQWPNVMNSFNIELPSDIAEDDLSAVPDLVQIGQQLASGPEWQALLAEMASGIGPAASSGALQAASHSS